MAVAAMAKRRAALLVGLSYIAFVSLGLPDGLIGVGWPSIRASYNLPLDALGALVSTFTVGYLVSSFSSGAVLAHFGVGKLLPLSCLATAASLLAYGLSPVWWLMVAFGVVSGLGAGAIDAGLNTYAANHFDTRTVNWLHACFGLGSTTGPLVMTAVLQAGQSWRFGFLIVGTAQLLLALCFWLNRTRWGDVQPAQNTTGPRQAAAPVFRTLRLPLVWVSIALFVIYTGTEVAVGQWVYSLLTEARGVSPVSAGVVVSTYWASLTAGRVVFGGLAGSRIPLSVMLRACFLTIVVGAALVWAPVANVASFAGIMLMGFALAPLFPSLIATTPARFGPQHTANAVGFQIAAASVGGAGLTSLVGVLAGKFGLEVLGVTVFLSSLLLYGLYELLNWMGSQKLGATSQESE